MSSTVQLRRRPAGLANPGSPPGNVGLDGEICVNLSTLVPELYVKSGGATGSWLRLNDAPAVTTQNIPLASGPAAAAADVGAAYVAEGNPTLTGSVITATWKGAAYLLTNKAAPGTAASWTSLGSATAFADAAAVLAGTSATEAINPLGLQSRIVAAPDAVPANDARKIVMLDAAGKIPAGFLTVQGLTFSAAAPTAAAPTHANGLAVFMNAAGVLDASYGIAPAPTVEVGDLLLSDGTDWHVLQADVDLANYVPKAGATTMGAAARLTFATTAPAPGAAPDVILDGGANGGTLDRVTLDGGAF